MPLRKRARRALNATIRRLEHQAAGFGEIVWSASKGEHRVKLLDDAPDEKTWRFGNVRKRSIVDTPCSKKAGLRLSIRQGARRWIIKEMRNWRTVR